MFKVKPSDPKELLKAILACQQNEKKEEVLIEARGLRVDPVPQVEDHELKWEPSGLHNPNSWRKDSSDDEARTIAFIDDMMNQF